MNAAARAAAALVCAALLAALGACDRAGAPADPAERLAAAERAFREQDLRRAVVELKALLAERPDEARARLLLGRAHLRLGDGASAEKELRRALELGVPYETLAVELARALLVQGRYGAVAALGGEGLSRRRRAELKGVQCLAALGAGEVRDAEQCLEQAERLDAHARWPVFAQARLLQARGRLAEAVALLARLAHEGPDDAVAEAAATALGRIERVRGRLEAAGRALARALELNRANHAARVERALLHLRRGELEAADRDLAVLARAAPTHPRVLYARGMRALVAGDMETALGLLTDAAREAASDPAIAVALGLTHARMGHREQAEQELRRAVGLRPGSLAPRLALGRLLLAWGEPGRALALVREAPAPLQGHPLLRALKGGALVALGRREAGVAELEAAAAALPPPSRLRLAMGIARAGELERALELTRDALEAVATPAGKEAADGGPSGAGSAQARDVIEAVLALTAGRPAAAEPAARRLVAAEPGRGAYWFLLGRALEGAGGRGQAREAYARVLDIEGTHLPAMLALARLARAAGARDEARRWLERAHAATPDSAEPALRLAALAREERRPDEALRWAREAVRRAPQLPRARLLLGLLLAERGDWSGAAEAAEAVLAGGRDHPQALLLLGRARQRLGEIERAERAYARLARLRPQGHRVWILLGGVREALGRPAQAEQAYRKALDAPGGEVPARLALARLAALRGEADAARRWLAGLPREVLESPPGLEARGRAAAAAGSWEEAARLLGRARRGGYGGRRLMLAHARALWRAGGRERAVRELEAWVSDHGRDTGVMKLLALWQRALGREARAIALLERVLEASPDDVVALNDLAYALRGRDPERAWALVRSALSRAPDSPEVLDTAARVLLARGNAAEAVRHAGRAVRARPDDARLRLTLAEALAAAGRREEALAEARRAAEERGGLSERELASARALLERLGRGEQGAGR